VDKEYIDKIIKKVIKEYGPTLKMLGQYDRGELSMGKIREFDTGATRDTDVGKLSYIKALSPVVLKRYVEYLGEHRTQSDGNLRDWDNWKKGIDKDIYLDGLGRHFWDTWLLSHGYPAEDNHGPVDIQDALCAIIFNSMGILFELLNKTKGEQE